MKTLMNTTTFLALSIVFLITGQTLAFTVTSPVVEEGGALPVEFTGDGDGSSIPVAWSDVPEGTQSFALNLWHIAPDQVKSYWVIYNIPADIRSLPKNVEGIGTVGYNDHDFAGYMPMMSQGPGVKEYHITVFALSAEPQFTTDKVTRTELLEAITDITLAEATLTYTYERFQTDNNGTTTNGGGGGVTAPGATLQQIGSGYAFTEGPAVDTDGNIYFSDLEASTIYRWSVDGTISTYLTDSGGANGLMFDAVGNLIACQGDLGRVVSIDASGSVTVLADQYNGLAFNKPNDLWIAPNGGIYFSDPAYGVTPVQNGEHVYYITPDHSQVIRVINDMVRPNGLIGRLDGSRLYVTDPGAGQTYAYDINADGTLTNKTLFAAIGGDGMTIDSRNNVYLATSDGIVVFNPEGQEKETILVPEEPTNVCLGGVAGNTLFITARSSLYTIEISLDNQGNVDPNNNGNQGTDSNISIEQAISDEAQMKTISFTGLAFLTGDLCSDSFFPPGKVSDFFGFQYRRDITPNGFGHNTVFAGNIADNVLGILTDDQVQLLVALANEQIAEVNAYAYQRFVLMKAFRRLIENDLPTGTSGLSLDAVMEFSADLYEIDANISYERAVVLGNIVTELTEDQQTAFVQLEIDLNTLFEQSTLGGTIDEADWPHPASPADLSGLTDDQDGRVLVSTFATQLFSWYLGSVEGDTYFCPERHGTYFGSFYMKDVPPISASEAITIDTNLTADMGQAFLDSLDVNQAQLITDLLDLQRPALNSIVATRQLIAEILRPFMEGIVVDQNEVVDLIREYGAYDGELIYHYATNFVNVAHSLTTDQEAAVMGLRLGYYELFPDYQADPHVYDCVGAWLYSRSLNEMPEIENTDFLFE